MMSPRKINTHFNHVKAKIFVSCAHVGSQALRSVRVQTAKLCCLALRLTSVFAFHLALIRTASLNL